MTIPMVLLGFVCQPRAHNSTTSTTDSALCNKTLVRLGWWSIFSGLRARWDECMSTGPCVWAMAHGGHHCGESRVFMTWFIRTPQPSRALSLTVVGFAECKYREMRMHPSVSIDHHNNYDLSEVSPMFFHDEERKAEVLCQSPSSILRSFV